MHAMKPVIILISAYHTCIRRPREGGGVRQDIAITFDTEKLGWCGYPKIKKKLKVCLFVLTECTNVTDTQTDRQTDRHHMTANAALA